MFGFGGIRRAVGAAAAGLVAAALLVAPAAQADPETDPPENVLPPAITGPARPGGTLRCSPGTWLDEPTLTTAWRTGSIPLGEGASYVVRSADVGAVVVCTVRAENSVGVSTASSSPVTVTAAPRTPSAPPAPSTACTGTPYVQAAGGVLWTRRRAVAIRVATPAGTTAVEIAGNPEFWGAQRRRLDARCTYRWTLADLPDGTPQRIYVRFPGATAPTTVSDVLRYDVSPPRVTKAHARWSNRSGGWVLRTRARDVGAGVASFETARRNGTVRRAHRLGRTVVSWDRSVLERVRFTDRLGNRSGWVRVRFLS